MNAPNLKPSEILAKAADLISPRGAWTQGTWARDKLGEETPTERDRRSVCWCVAGALWVIKPEGPRVERAILARSLGIDPGRGLVDWNDAPGRTQAEVVAALRKASELARSEGQ